MDNKAINTKINKTKAMQINI